MSNDLKVKTDNAVDGFGGFNDGVEGTDAALPVGIIRGALVKFSIDRRKQSGLKNSAKCRGRGRNK